MPEFLFERYLNHLSLDCVIFGFHENQLKVLLLQMKYSKEWELPGGFVKKTESMEEAAARTLEERTGLKDIFLQQFYIFSNPQRSRNNPAVKDLLKSSAGTNEKWFNQRFVSVGFYALVDFEKAVPMHDFFSEKCEWKSLEEIDRLMIDHNHILEKALETLRLHMSYLPIGYNLLPEKFTMPELQKLYETLLGRKLDRRNFQRKILSWKILNKLEEQKKGSANKAPYLYEFNLENYNRILKGGPGSNW